MEARLTLDASLLFLPMLDTLLPLMEMLAPEGRMAAPLKGLAAAAEACAEVMLTPDVRAASPCRLLLAALTLHNKEEHKNQGCCSASSGHWPP